MKCWPLFFCLSSSSLLIVARFSVWHTVKYETWSHFICIYQLRKTFFWVFQHLIKAPVDCAHNQMPNVTALVCSWSRSSHSSSLSGLNCCRCLHKSSSAASVEKLLSLRPALDSALLASPAPWLHVSMSFTLNTCMYTHSTAMHLPYTDTHTSLLTV